MCVCVCVCVCVCCVHVCMCLSLHSVLSSLLCRLHEEVELMEDEMKRREGGMAMESNVEMEKAL